MEKNILRQLHSNINLNTYKTIQKINLWTISGLTAARLFLLNNYPLTKDVIGTITNLLCIYAISSYISKSDIYTKDIKEIRELYNELITKYNKLNDTFNFNHPVEIYTMFNYLLYRGYISKNNEFEYNKDHVKDIKSLYGADVISGQAVCRHIASMLNDIYKQRDIESYLLPVLVRKEELNMYNKINDKKMSKKDLDNLIRQIKNHKIDYGTKTLVYFKYELSDKYAEFHAINMAVYKDKAYYVDSTQTKIYKIGQDKNTLIDNEDEDILICPNSFYTFNKIKDVKNIKKYLKLSDTSSNENFNTINNTINILKNNQDIYEKFYNENKTLYEDISNKMSNINQQHKLIKKIL